MPEVQAARLILELPDEAATALLAEDVAAVLRPGDLVALSGGLGVGKTSFARALVRALAGDAAMEVPSPTFPIRIDHRLPRLGVIHADLYRLAGTEDLDEIGLEDGLSEAALLIEWPEKLPFDLAKERLDVALEISGDGRRASISGAGTWPARMARTRAIRTFLARSGWADGTRHPLAGDASSRAYERISARPPDLRSAAEPTAILMNAPAREPGPALHAGRSYDAVAHRALDVRPFIAIGMALRQAGIRAPEIRAADAASGLLLLEDLGSEAILDAAGAPVLERYEAAVDLLVAMHGRDWPVAVPLPDGDHYSLPLYDHDALLVEISLFPDWFGGHGGLPAFSASARADFLAAWSHVLKQIDAAPTTWVMRDFHSPNILWQPRAYGLARIGVLDFQDALIGHPAYDLASLAQDARAPLAKADEAALKARYFEGRRRNGSKLDRIAFEAAYAILAAQRATKVLGAFTRLELVDNKPGYARHRTRLRALLRRNLAHPVLSGLRVWYEPYL